MWQNVSISPNLETWILRMHWISVLMEKVSTMFLVESCGIPFPMELRPLAQLCTELQSCSSLDRDKWVSYSAVILVDSFVIFVLLIRALWEVNFMAFVFVSLSFFFLFFLVFQTQWDVTMNVRCRDGGFVLRNKGVGGMWWKCTTESYTLP